MTDNYRLNGGASRDRTDDPLLAKQVLSQLSYGPLRADTGLKIQDTSAVTFIFSLVSLYLIYLVGLGGFEPPTSPLSGVRSNQLSYRPGVIVCRSGSCEQQMHGRYSANYLIR
jgi:hypothetical protein